MAVRVFFDANIYFSAARSPLGGSSLVIEFVKKRKLKLFATAEVLREAERNLRLKENIQVLIRYYENLKSTNPKIIKVNKDRTKKKFRKVINEKDALVLAGAERAKADYLVSLDKRHFFTKKINQARLSFKVVTPGQLIEKLRA